MTTITVGKTLGSNCYLVYTNKLKWFTRNGGFEMSKLGLKHGRLKIVQTKLLNALIYIYRPRGNYKSIISLRI
jgi:hypothetical protein